MFLLPPNIRMLKSRILLWLVHVVSVGERRHACKILVEKPEGERPLGSYAKIILKLILKK
jgi:hypothetical protein